ncbi:hypothetical protein M0R04_10460 [Candidatus Dojkabacteria bacterium]|jgi:hypothetical protein|nr:hypothetical protein [Candidatus Dojkabacteria bacterium]
MGADLYIHNIYEKNRTKYQDLFDKWVDVRNTFPSDSKQHISAQKKVSYYWDKMSSRGYFRDSYNDTNLLNKFDLSYWHNDFISEEGILLPSRAKELLAELKKREPIFKKNVKKINLSEWEKGCTRAKLQKYFDNKYKEFKKFLNEAIKLDEDIDCSV